MNEQKKETGVDTLFDVGEAWASYGLKVAELALEASARTLTGVSKVLGQPVRGAEAQAGDRSDRRPHTDLKLALGQPSAWPGHLRFAENPRPCAAHLSLK